MTVVTFAPMPKRPRQPEAGNPQPQPVAFDWDTYLMNLAITAILDLLSALPSLNADFGSAVAAWHNAHGDVAKTQAAVTAATQIITAAGAVAAEVLTPVPAVTSTGNSAG